MEVAMDDRYRPFIGPFIARLSPDSARVPGTLRGFEFFRQKSVTLTETPNNTNNLKKLTYKMMLRPLLSW
jgi:hypothetical protein